MGRQEIVQSDGDEVRIGGFTILNVKAITVAEEPTVEAGDGDDSKHTATEVEETEVEEVAQAAVDNGQTEAAPSGNEDPSEAAPVTDEGGSSNDDLAADGDAASTATDEPVGAADESSDDDGVIVNEPTPPSGEEATDDQGNESSSTAAELGPNSSTDSGGDTAEAAPIDSDLKADATTPSASGEVEYHH